MTSGGTGDVEWGGPAFSTHPQYLLKPSNIESSMKGGNAATTGGEDHSSSPSLLGLLPMLKNDLFSKERVNPLLKAQALRGAPLAHKPSERRRSPQHSGKLDFACEQQSAKDARRKLHECLAPSSLHGPLGLGRESRTDSERDKLPGSDNGDTTATESPASSSPTCSDKTPKTDEAASNLGFRSRSLGGGFAGSSRTSSTGDSAPTSGRGSGRRSRSVGTRPGSTSESAGDSSDSEHSEKGSKAYHQAPTLHQEVPTPRATAAPTPRSSAASSPASEELSALRRETTEMRDWLLRLRAEQLPPPLPAPCLPMQAAVTGPTPRLVPSPKWMGRSHSAETTPRIPETISSKAATPIRPVTRAAPVFEEDILCCPMEDPAEVIAESGPSPRNSRRRLGARNGVFVDCGGLQSAPYRHRSNSAADEKDSVRTAFEMPEVTRRRALSSLSPQPSVARRRACSHQPVLGEFVVPLAVAAQVTGVPISGSASPGDYPSRPSSALSTGELPSSKSPCGSQGSGSPLQTRTSNTPRSESSTGSYEAWRAALRARILADTELQVRARIEADTAVETQVVRDEKETPFQNLFASQLPEIGALSP